MNLPTLLVLLLVLLVFALALWLIIRGKIASCSYGCEQCALRRVCKKE